MAVSFKIADRTVSFGGLEPYTQYELRAAFPSMDLSDLKLSDIVSRNWQSERQLLFMLPSMKKLHDNMVLSAAAYLENKLSLEESSIPCPGCGDKKVSMATKQVRSMDEPTTAFYACSGCGKRWQEG